MTSLLRVIVDIVISDVISAISFVVDVLDILCGVLLLLAVLTIDR